MIFAVSSPGEVRALAVVDGVLTDLAIERPGHPDHFGAVFGAIVTARVPAMAGAFLDLGGRLAGFLPDSEGAKGRSAGDRVAVRVTRSAQGDKGPRLSAHGVDVPCPTQGLLTPGPGAIERLARLHPAAAIVVDDLALLANLPPAIRARATLRTALPDADALDRMAELETPFAALPGGARAEITPTAALTAIDIDARAAAGGRATHEAINRALIPALSRELRLRNLSGGIVIDFAGLSARGRGKLGTALQDALAADPLAPKFLGFSALGLAEIVRARTTAPLHEFLRGPVAALIAALRAAAADPSARTLIAAPDVIAAADPVSLDALARRRAPLALRADPAMAPGIWRLSGSAIAGAARAPQV